MRGGTVSLIVPCSGIWLLTAMFCCLHLGAYFPGHLKRKPYSYSTKETATIAGNSSISWVGFSNQFTVFY